MPHGLFTNADYADVEQFFDSRPELTPTPLVGLPALASSLGVDGFLVKDESSRFGMNAFKIAGVAYAVDRLLRHGTARVLACATEGNHGRAVARAARERGLRAVVYMRESAAAPRIAAIRREGAEVVLVPGVYDDAVKRMAAEAERDGFTIVSDTSWAGYEAVPRAIMAGYTRIMSEASRQWAPGPPPAVVVVQAGVGGLAGAVASWLLSMCPADRRPYLICAEPAVAACVGASLAAGRPAAVTPGDTSMAGLRCGEMSPIAFAPLAAAVDACVTVDDGQVARAIERLAHPLGGDPSIDAGPSGACGVAALVAWLDDGRYARDRARVLASRGSRALAINTEGDPARLGMIGAASARRRCRAGRSRRSRGARRAGA